MSLYISKKKSYRNANGSRHEETTTYKMDTFSLDGGASRNIWKWCFLP